MHAPGCTLTESKSRVTGTGTDVVVELVDVEVLVEVDVLVVGAVVVVVLVPGTVVVELVVVVELTITEAGPAVNELSNSLDDPAFLEALASETSCPQHRFTSRWVWSRRVSRS